MTTDDRAKFEAQDEPEEQTDWYPGMTQKHYDNAVGRAVAAALASTQAASAEPVAREMILPPGATTKERFRVSDDGLGIWDEDFTFDANLKISGDFTTEDDKRAYARELVALLNTTPAPAVAPAAQSAETAWANLPAALKAHPGIKALYRAALASQKGA